MDVQHSFEKKMKPQLCFFLKEPFSSLVEPMENVN